MKKIIFLSSTAEGKELLEWVKKQNCEIVFSETDNEKILDFPKYDLGFGFLYTHKIPPTEFSIPNKWINFHPGSLPEYRGRNLAYHALMNDSEFFGASIHFMTEKYDEGDIIEVVNFPISATDTAGVINKKSIQILVGLFKKHFNEIIENKVVGVKQEKGFYYKKIEIENLIDLTAEQKKKIRALTVEDKFSPLVNVNGKVFKIIPS